MHLNYFINAKKSDFPHFSECFRIFQSFSEGVNVLNIGFYNISCLSGEAKSFRLKIMNLSSDNKK